MRRNNLLSNAMKFTKSGVSVSLILKIQDDFAVVQVSDTGCDISVEEGRHIYENFYQGDTSHTTQGNGLGLALIKRVIDIVGGTMLIKTFGCAGNIYKTGKTLKKLPSQIVET